MPVTGGGERRISRLLHPADHADCGSRRGRFAAGVDRLGRAGIDDRAGDIEVGLARQRECPGGLGVEDKNRGDNQNRHAGRAPGPATSVTESVARYVPFKHGVNAMLAPEPAVNGFPFWVTFQE